MCFFVGNTNSDCSYCIMRSCDSLTLCVLLVTLISRFSPFLLISLLFGGLFSFCFVTITKKQPAMFFPSKSQVCSSRVCVCVMDIKLSVHVRERERENERERERESKGGRKAERSTILSLQQKHTCVSLSV